MATAAAARQTIVAAPWRTAIGFRSISTITWVRISPAKIASRRQNNDKSINPRLKPYRFGTVDHQLMLTRGQ